MCRFAPGNAEFCLEMQIFVSRCADLRLEMEIFASRYAGLRLRRIEVNVYKRLSDANAMESFGLWVLGAAEVLSWSYYYY